MRFSKIKKIVIEGIVQSCKEHTKKYGMRKMGISELAILAGQK